MGKEKNTLEGFEGFQEVTAEDYNWDFGGEASKASVTTAEVVEEVLRDDLTEEEKTKIAEEKAEQKLIDDVFKDFENPTVVEDEEEEIEDKSTTSATTKTSKVATLEFLKEKGLVEYELEEGKVLTDEEAEELIEDSWETALENEVELAIKELPDSVKALVKIAVKGGNTDQFLKTMYNQAITGITKDTDMTVEENQVLALQIDLRNQDYDQEYIDTHIQSLKDAGKLAAMAEKVSAKIIKKQEDDLLAQAKAVEDAKTSRKEGIKKQKAELSEHVTTLDNIKGVVLNKKDKEVLPSYISVPAVELQDGRVITKMQEDLFKAMADKDKLLLLGKLLHSDFDFSSISNATITAYSKGVKDNVQNAKQGKDKDTVKSSGSSQKTKKYLADMLD